MSGVAAHVATLKAKATTIFGDATEGSEVKGLVSIDFGQSAELLDVTHFDDGQYRARILGLRDSTLSISGDYIFDDPGQGLLEANFNAGNVTYIAFIPIYTSPSGNAGDDGFVMPVQVQDYNLTAAVDGKLEFSMTLMQAGAVTTIGA